MRSGAPAEHDLERKVDALRRELEARTAERDEAWAQQAATVEILRVINRSPGDLAPVVDAILEKATLLCEASFGMLSTYAGDDMHQFVAMRNLPDAVAKLVRDPVYLGPETGLGRLVRGEGFVHIHNAMDDEGYRRGNPLRRALVDIAGTRTYLAVPLRKDSALLGAFTIYRREVRPFAEKQIALLQGFAAQAVIALENARLFEEVQAKTRDLQDSLQQQTATADVLKVISRSAFDLHTVLQTLVESAARLCDADMAQVTRQRDGVFLRAESCGYPEEFIEYSKAVPVAPDRGSAAGRALLDGRACHIPDVLADPGYTFTEAHRIAKFRAALAVPMLRDGVPIGLIVMNRKEPRPFTEKQIELATTFADQAAIAIGNVRLFDEVQAKTRDLQESLQQQTATADVLKVISRSAFDLQTVLDTLVESAARLCEADHGIIVRPRDGEYRVAASWGLPHGTRSYLEGRRFAPGTTSVVDRALLESRIVHVEDVLADPAYSIADDPNPARTRLGVPLLREGAPIGVFALTHQDVHPFTDKQIELVTTFADQAVIAIENARLFDEVQIKTRDIEEALRYQTGSANILNVIASSPTDVQPVLKAIVESACELCDAHDAVVLLKDASDLCFSAHHGPIPINTERWPIGRAWASGRAVIDRATVHVHDIYAEDASDFAAGRELSRRAGSTAVRSILAAPLLREGESIGAILLRRQEVRPFNDKQIAMLQTFADQAVIALGNVRLFEEVQAKTRDIEEALRYQTGSANILNVIAASPTDVRPVLKAIVESACELCQAYDAAVVLKDGDDLRFSAHHGPIPIGLERWPINRRWTAGRAFIDRKPVHIEDLRDEKHADFSDGRELALRMGHRSILSVPLLREGESIGAIVLRRTEVNPFSDKQIALLQTFADQAVIALGNVRLFEEVQAKTHDLEEALRYQTGSANILNVIASSPTDVQPVLKAIVESACELCDAYDALVRLKQGEGMAFGAHHGPLPVSLESVPFSANSTAGLAMIERRPVHVHDLLSPDGDIFPNSQELARAHGERTILSVPLLREGEGIGAIILRRTEVHPFSDKQIALLQTFADQAVIALGNVRLFEEVQARTRDLQESLQQQTATADVLKVISRSTFDLQTVLDTLLTSAARLCQADHSFIFLRDGEAYRFAAGSGGVPEWIDYLKQQTIQPGRGTVAARAVLEGQTVHIPDVLADSEYTFLEAQKRGQFRTALGIPLLREGVAIGVMVLTRPEVRPFDAGHITLVTTFADQAVIAIENIRLFESVEARTRDLQESLQQQTATADVLKVISRSAFDLQVVLDTLVESAARLCEADMSVITRQRGDTYYRAGSFGFAPEFMEYVKDLPIKPERATITGRTLLEGKVTHVHDTYADPDYSFPKAQRLSGDPRTILGVPLLREGKPVGALALLRKNVRPFTDKQIELVTTFADQAVIAIENVRLFDEVQARTRELAESLDDLRTAQDRLVQTEKLASLGQLTAGIAHEIKNPLNFVNNFSALSVELTDELNEVLRQADIADKLRAEVDELTGFLKDNLAKVVQHGKRADSIVKNMLLHSREGSGEHRPADINALVDESLNLAYHGARAEKPQFNVTLQRNFDPEAGMVDVFPQEITRVFLNLLSNGFYAVTKRKAGDRAGFEPTVSAMTKGRSDRVEIRIRDNGTGIPPEVKEKMFNPFFTTKPAGEGTGLGLSMSYDIIVKQHGGTIDVETVPEEFTEFTIVLPRTNVSRKN